MSGDVFFKTVTHFFPKLTKWLALVDDPRNKNKITYSSSHLLWLGIFLFLLRLGSKRKIKYKLSTEELVENLNKLCSEYNQNVAHHDIRGIFSSKVAARRTVRGAPEDDK